MADWKVKLNGNKYTWFGGGGSTVRDDLDKITETLHTNKEKLLEKNQTIYQDIKIKKINAWTEKDTAKLIAVQFIYQVEADNSLKEITGHRHGGQDGGVADGFTFENPSYIMRLRANTGTGPTSWNIVNRLDFVSFNPENNWNNIVGYGNMAGTDTLYKTAMGVFISRALYLLDAFGYYEFEIVNNDKQKIDQLKHWTDTFKELTPEKVKEEFDNPKEIHKPEDLEKHKPEDLRPPLLPDDWKEQLAKIPTLEANQKPDDYETIKRKLAEWEKNFPNQEPSAVKSQVDNSTTSSNSLNDYWNQIIAKDYANGKSLDQAGLSSLHTTLVKNKTDIKILAAKRDQYYKELFSIKVGEMENRLVRFSLEVYIDKDNIKQEIGDLKQVIKENVTLDNLAISEETLKTLILISSAYNAQSKSLTKHKLLSIQKKYMELKGNVPWNNNQLYTKYQKTIEKYQESKNIIDNLVNKA